MITDISLEPYPLYVGMILSVVFFIYWIVRRKRRKATIEVLEKTESYSKTQKLGIFVVLIFILPFSLITMSYLARGILFLWIVPINMLSNFSWLHLPLQTVGVALSYFSYFAGPYFVCEYLWPSKKKGYENNMFI